MLPICRSSPVGEGAILVLTIGRLYNNSNMKFHCLRCGNKLEKKSSRESSCPKCGYAHYVNPYPTTSVIIENENGEIMLVKRKYNPKKGYWDLPGGFVDLNESGEECSRREIIEELGIKLKKLIYLGSYPDKYF